MCATACEPIVRPASETASHTTSRSSTRMPAAYAVSIAEHASDTRADRRSVHSKPCITTSATSVCGRRNRKEVAMLSTALRSTSESATATPVRSPSA